MTGNFKAFIDSNVWLYALTDENDERNGQAEKLIKAIAESVCVSAQVINEVCLNLKRKASADEAEINRLIRSFYLDYKVIEQNQEILLKASELRMKYDFSFWDGLIVAAALAANAEILYSEDMQNGLIIENSLKIVNPFV
ncbi:MAG TPA: PIN domain-containing protein [Pyrinomonadaceae bacterium]|nr:PIN domain-containing protein [Pyrinomonadaceae bacterium]